MRIGIAALATLLASASAASADIITYTYTGYASSYTGFIGLTPTLPINTIFGTFVAGGTATLTIIENTSKGTITEVDPPGLAKLTNTGSSPNNPISVSLTYNGVTFVSNVGSGLAEIWGVNNPPRADQRLDGSINPGGVLYETEVAGGVTYGGLFPGPIPFTFDQNFSIVPDPAIFLSSSFSFGEASFTDPVNVGSRINFTTTLATAVTQAVPEPLTLSIFGAGLAGAFVARRRKKMA